MASKEPTGAGREPDAQTYTVYVCVYILYIVTNEMIRTLFHAGKFTLNNSLIGDSESVIKVTRLHLFQLSQTILQALLSVDIQFKNIW